MAFCLGPLGHGRRRGLAPPRMRDSSIYDSTGEITRFRYELADHIVNRGPEAGIIRLILFGSLIRAYLWLAEKSGWPYAAGRPGRK